MTTTRPKITIITMARKPVSEANVTANVRRWKADGINVDAMRIGSEERVNPPASAKSLNDLKRTMGAGWREDQPATARKGRWPANVILSHQGECQCVGSVRVKTSKAGPKSHAPSIGGGGDGAQMKEFKHYGTDTYGDADGMEEVLSWLCVASCPVADLDRQGVGTGSHPAGKKSSKFMCSDYDASSYKMQQNGIPRETFRYGDEGGVSRFFKQVQEVE